MSLTCLATRQALHRLINRANSDDVVDIYTAFEYEANKDYPLFEDDDTQFIQIKCALRRYVDTSDEEAILAACKNLKAAGNRAWESVVYHTHPTNFGRVVTTLADREELAIAYGRAKAALEADPNDPILSQVATANGRAYARACYATRLVQHLK